MSVFATVDVGTNTTLLLVGEADASGIRVLYEQAEITRLGRGIGQDARLGREGIDRTLATLTGYGRQARAHNARIIAVGTEGLRRASNAAEFLVPAEAALGAPVTIIDGNREAALTFLATRRSFPEATAQEFAVIDIGGGSTEIVQARGDEVLFRRSLPLGSVRLTERFITHDPPTSAELANIDATIADALAGVPRLPVGSTVVGVAGTVTTLAAMTLGLTAYDADRVHGFGLSQAALATQRQRLEQASAAEREHMAGLDPKRADVIVAGARLLAAIGQHLGAKEILVSDRGIRWGLLYEALDGLAAAPTSR